MMQASLLCSFPHCGGALGYHASSRVVGRGPGAEGHKRVAHSKAVKMPQAEPGIASSSRFSGDGLPFPGLPMCNIPLAMPIHRVSSPGRF
jgi:hypothetical protein